MSKKERVKLVKCISCGTAFYMRVNFVSKIKRLSCPYCQKPKSLRLAKVNIYGDS